MDSRRGDGGAPECGGRVRAIAHCPDGSDSRNGRSTTGRSARVARLVEVHFLDKAPDGGHEHVEIAHGDGGFDLDMRDNEVPDTTVIDEVVVLAERNDSGDNAHGEHRDETKAERLGDLDVPQHADWDCYQYNIANDIGDDLAHGNLFTEVASSTRNVGPSRLRNANPEFLRTEEEAESNETTGDHMQVSPCLAIGCDANDGPKDGESSGPDGEGKAHFQDVKCDYPGVLADRRIWGSEDDPNAGDQSPCVEHGDKCPCVIPPKLAIKLTVDETPNRHSGGYGTEHCSEDVDLVECWQSHAVQATVFLSGVKVKRSWSTANSS